jgi:hypothetical protein
MKDDLDYFDEVFVLNPSVNTEEIGKGVVVGISTSDDGVDKAYTVYEFKSGIATEYNADQLKSTGIKISRERIYSGDSIKIIYAPDVEDKN